MRFKNAVQLRPGVIALAAAIALSAGVSPAAAATAIPRGVPIDDPEKYGDWIADVERPAEQFRGRLQVQLGAARGLLRP